MSDFSKMDFILFSRISAVIVRFAVLVLAWPSPLLAEHDSQDIAYVSPTVPNDPNLAKITMLRLWYVGGAQAPQITLAREPQGKPPFVIESHLQAGIFSPYVPLKAGKFLLHILDGNVTAPKEPTQKLPLKEKKLTDPIDLELKPGTYATLIVTEKSGVLSARVVEDKRPSDGSAPMLRVQDLSGLDKWKVKLLDRNQNLIRELWNSSMGGTGEVVAIPGAGIYRFQVMREVNGESRQMGLFEAKLSAASPFTILLYPGPDGNGATNLTFDAAPGNYYNAASVKAAASEEHVVQ